METDFALKFPIGKCQQPESFDPARVAREVDVIAAFPSRLRAAVDAADPARLGERYRPGGWTALQVVHHVADSHLNAYTRFKLALTEDNPTIKPYAEDRWALLPDYSLPPEAALALIESLHHKWAALLRALSDQDWQRTFFHPESRKIVPLFRNVAIYAWHGEHHLRQFEIAVQGGLSPR